MKGCHTPEQARICIWGCDHAENPHGCVVDGAVYPDKRRCALERHLAEQVQVGELSSVAIPDGFVSTREAAQLLNVTYNTILNWIKARKFPGAVKQGEYRSARWAIPEGQVIGSRDQVANSR